MHTQLAPSCSSPSLHAAGVGWTLRDGVGVGTAFSENRIAIVIQLCAPSHDVTGNLYHVLSALCKAMAQLQSKAFTTILVHALYVRVDLVNWRPQANIRMGPYTFAHIYQINLEVPFFCRDACCCTMVPHSCVQCFHIIYVHVIMGFFHLHLFI